MPDTATICKSCGGKLVKRGREAGWELWECDRCGDSITRPPVEKWMRIPA